MAYVDGFVIPVPKSKLAAYRSIAKKAAKIFKEHGALSYYECAGDDLKPSFGLPFPKLVKPKANETIVFSWVVYASKAARNRANKAVMADDRMHLAPEDMPFDVKRMAYGGFKVIVEA